MIEHLNFSTHHDPKTYPAKVGCFNCDNSEVILIKKGVLIEDWLRSEKIKCSNCECNNSLQPWKEYLAGRAMLTQIVALSKKEEDIYSKSFKHFG